MSQVSVDTENVSTLDSSYADTIRVIMAAVFIVFKKKEKQHLKSQSGFGVNDYFSKP